jgi:hypothetical protein
MQALPFSRFTVFAVIKICNVFQWKLRICPSTIAIAFCHQSNQLNDHPQDQELVAKPGLPLDGPES